MDISQVREFVVAPALADVAGRTGIDWLDSRAARQIVFGTGLAESGGYRWIRQLPRADGARGPGRGFGQVEPETCAAALDWAHRRSSRLSAYLDAHIQAHGGVEEALVLDLAFNAVISRLVYAVKNPAPLPPAGNWARMGEEWKQYYNTAAGAGDPATWLNFTAAQYAQLDLC
jgi:hypothetical protein